MVQAPSPESMRVLFLGKRGIRSKAVGSTQKKEEEEKEGSEGAGAGGIAFFFPSAFPGSPSF